MSKDIIETLLYSTPEKPSRCGESFAFVKKGDPRCEPSGQAIGIGYYYAVWLGRRL